ncbi:MAG: hypothetical protein GY756_11885, partial [bacterium]|nr:hypothetical protein [bacterium]
MESHFLKEEIEIVPGKTFFNLFIIQNKTSKNISFNLNFALPRNWVLIGDLNQKYTIGGNEKITIPVRVAVSKESMGGIGYVISAAISDESNSVFETKYCYLKIPAKPLLEINTLRENRYFSHKTKRTSFFLKIANKGNIDEYVNLKIEPDLTLDIKKSADEDFVENIHIKPNSDTITKFTFSLKSDEDFKHYSVHKAIITVKGRDTLIKRTVWFNHLDWKYENILPETEIPLIIELAAYNIFSKTNAIFIGRIYGTVLFNNNVDFFYSLENYSRDSETNSLWINSKISAGIRAKKINIFIGDYQGSLEQSMYGRGIYTDYSPTEKIKLKAVFTKGIERPVLNFGGEYEQKLKIPLTLRIGGAYTKGEDYIPDSKLLFGGAKLRVFKNNIRLLYGNSITTYNLTSGLKSYNGFGYELSYAGKINKFNIRMDNLYGSSLYSGYTKGRFIFNSSIGYSISNKSFLDFSYLNQRYKPVYFVGEDLFNDRFSNYELYKLQFRYKLSNTVELFGGPQIVNLSSNSFPSYDVESILASLTAKGEVGFMVSEKYTYNSLMFTARYTYTNIYKYSEILNETYYPTINSEPVSGFDMNLNLRRKNWGTYIIYKQGPQTIYNMYSYLYSSYVAKTFYIIPFYERYLFKKFVKLTVRGSYLNNISSKISRINVNPRLSWGFKGGWSFHFSGNISFQKLQDDSKNKFYTGTYFEFGIRKEFNFQQPRVKYY